MSIKPKCNAGLLVTGFSGSWLAFGLCVLAPFLATSNASLWIDEALTAVKAQQPTLGQWWRAIVEERVSDLQMPVYMLYIWGFEKIFGSAEWVLRMANAPWFVAGAVLFLRRFASNSVKLLTMGFVTAFSPFAWAYLNEARPYAMTLAASLAVFATVSQLIGNDIRSTGAYKRMAAQFSIAGFVLAGSSLLGMVWLAAGVAGLFLAVPKQKTIALVRAAGAWLWLTLGWFVLLGLYYAWTLSIGARGTAVGGTNWLNILFVMYELFGFAGLGPGRLDIRASGVGAFGPHIPPLGVFAVATGAVVLGAARSFLRANYKAEALKMCGCLVVTGAALFLLGWAVHWRVLGRHVAPLLAVVVAVLGFGLHDLLTSRSGFRRAIAAVFVVLMVVSCLQLRFCARHSRDDYRQAALIARSALAQGRCVWWNADRSGAKYYRVEDIGDIGRNDQIFYLVNPTDDNLVAMAVPEVIVASRPDVYDNQGAVARYVSEGRFEVSHRLPGFVIWSRTQHQ